MVKSRKSQPAESGASMQSDVPPEGNKGEPHRWQPGESGNPKGRPSVKDELYGVLMESDAVSGKRKVLLVAEALVNQARKGNVRAIEAILERTDGKEAQPVTFGGELTIEHIQQLPDDDLDAELARTTAALEAAEAGTPGRKAGKARAKACLPAPTD